MTTRQSPDDWSGARYQSAPILVGPLLVVISMMVAGSFHRERLGVSAEAPVGEGVRAAGRLVGALVLVALVIALTVAGAVAARWYGGFDLGDEPGRTLHAQFTLPELLQPVALVLLAVAVGAAAGRRLRHRATATLLLFVGWFPFVTVSWAFQGRRMTPFSILQIQPVSVDVGPVTANPLDFPSRVAALPSGGIPGPLGTAGRLRTAGGLAQRLAARADLPLPRRRAPAWTAYGAPRRGCGCWRSPAW